MSDILRVARLDPRFLAGATLWLVETSEPLRVLQRQRLGDRPNWVAGLAEVPTGRPLLLVANELLDCFPLRQFQREARGEMASGNKSLGEFNLEGNQPDRQGTDDLSH